MDLTTITEQDVQDNLSTLGRIKRKLYGQVVNAAGTEYEQPLLDALDCVRNAIIFLKARRES